MIRAAVIGTGAMGRHHARIYKELPGVELVAIADANQEAAQKIGDLYGVPGYQDYQELLNTEKPEVVSIAVPTNKHFDVTTGCLEAGCHVLVEKPITATVDEADRLIATAEHAQRTLMVGHIERFNPAITELKRRLDEGQLGNIFQIHARRIGPYPSRIQDAGVILDLVPHDLDIMRYLLGQEVVRIYAESQHEIGRDHEDLMTGIVRFENNVLGLFEINWLTPTKIRELYVTGERGMFVVNYITQDLFFYENAFTQGEEWQTMSLLRGVSEGTMVRYAINKTEPLRAELDSFIQAVQAGSPPAMNGSDARTVLGLTLSVIESAQNGTTIVIQNVKQ